MLEPLHVTQPLEVSAQCSLPLVNVGVLELLRQKASPRLVCCSTSPLPLGSANSQVVGSPTVAPRWALRPARPSANVGVWPAPQPFATGAADFGAFLGGVTTATLGGPAPSVRVEGAAAQALLDIIGPSIACSFDAPVA